MRKLWSWIDVPGGVTALIIVPLMALMLLGATVVKEFPRPETALAIVDLAQCGNGEVITIEGYEPDTTGLVYEAAFVGDIKIVVVAYTDDTDIVIWARTGKGIEQFDTPAEFLDRYDSICDLPDVASPTTGI